VEKVQEEAMEDKEEERQSEMWRMFILFSCGSVEVRK
jgi:hypothetical protein